MCQCLWWTISILRGARSLPPRAIARNRCSNLRVVSATRAARSDHSGALDPHLARPAAPSRTIQPALVLTRTGQPGPPHICTLTVALSTCPHTFRLPPTMACRIGPLALSSCTATVLAHGPVLGPALPHRHPSCPAAPQTGTARTILHPGQCSTSPPPQPGAALRLIAPPLFGAALVHACLCTSLHRCTPRTATLSMRSAAPCGSA